MKTTREVRAAYDARTLTVYQAYPSEIADAALEAGTFVPPFDRDRMTWAKPSFLWTMHRSGWAEEPGQERVLAVSITREGFEWALAHAVPSRFDRSIHRDAAEWRREKKTSPVRVQWDPDRDLHMRARPERAIQVGLTGEAVRRYVDEWIVGIADVTRLARRIHAAVRADDLEAAAALLPVERPYPLPGAVRRGVGASR